MSHDRPADETPDAEPTVDPSYPALYESFDASSASSQRRFVWLTRASLVSTVVAAAGGVGSIGDGPDWAAVISLVAFIAAGGCRLLLLQEHPERTWYDARAGAESVKTLAWQYAVGGGPFKMDDRNETADAARARLTERFRALVQSTRGLTLPPDPMNRQITRWMASLRNQPLTARRQAYVDGRLVDQVRWYSGAANRHERLAKRWAIATILLQAAGVLAATLRATGTIDLDLMGVAAAAAAGAAAWLESRDHSGLTEAYATTAHELALVRDDLPDNVDESRWALFVADAEAAISREHTSWLARRRAQTPRGVPTT